MEEVYKDVPGFEGLYQVSNLGNVRSVDRIDSEKHFRKGQIMKQKMSKGPGRGAGYMRVGLRDGKKQKCYQVHRLVAEAFIPNPDNLPQVNHKDCNPSNNCVDNLEWCDAQYNLSYGDRAEKVSKVLKGRRNTWCWVAVLCYSQDGEYLGRYENIAEAAKDVGLAATNISACCRGRYKQVGGYKWRYDEDSTT